jgi:hypothetical protein
VDTGDRVRNSDLDYPPKLNPFFQRKVKITVAPEEEVGPRLAALGVDPARDLRAVVMTVKALATEEPCVLLLGHDSDVRRRLKGRICMPGAKEEDRADASEKREAPAQP